MDSLERELSPRAKAFNLVMRRLHAMQSDILPVRMPENAVNIPPPERAIDADVRDALLLWGIDVPEDWLAEVPAYVPIVLPPRPTVNAFVNGNKGGDGAGGKGGAGDGDGEKGGGDDAEAAAHQRN